MAKTTLSSCETRTHLKENSGTMATTTKTDQPQHHHQDRFPNRLQATIGRLRLWTRSTVGRLCLLRRAREPKEKEAKVKEAKVKEQKEKERAKEMSTGRLSRVSIGRQNRAIGRNRLQFTNHTTGRNQLPNQFPNRTTGRNLLQAIIRRNRLQAIIGRNPLQARNVPDVVTDVKMLKLSHFQLTFQ